MRILFAREKYFNSDFYPEFFNQKVILYLGRLHPKKGIDLAIRAFAISLPSIKGVKFLIAGVGDQEYTQRLIQLVKFLKVEEYVIFVGEISEADKVKILPSADIFVLSSYGENFGISVVEALASGLPVIVSNKVAISSKLLALNAAIVTNCDEAEIAEAIKELLLNSRLWNRLHQNGPAIASQFFR